MLQFDPRNPALSKACVSVLNQYTSKQISEEEFDKELAYMNLRYCLSDLKKKPYPEPSTALYVFSRMDEEAKKDFSKNNRAAYVEVISPELDANEHIRNFNDRNKKCLQGMIALFNKLGDKKSEDLCFTALRTHE